MTEVAQYRSSPLTLTDGQSVYLLTDENGRLVVTTDCVGATVDQLTTAMTSFADVTLDVATLTQVFGSSSIPTQQGVLLCAPPTNSDPAGVRVGDAGVGPGRGAVLLPGQSIVLPVTDANLVYAWAASPNQVLQLLVYG